MNRIVFLHIPKTAGQSVRKFLEMAFPTALVFPGFEDRHLALHSLANLERQEIFAGHFSSSLLEFLPDRFLTFTILRPPAERIVSLHRYYCAIGKTMLSEELNMPANRIIKASVDLPFDEFVYLKNSVYCEVLAPAIDNYYLYYFSTRCFNGRHLIRDNFSDSDFYMTNNVLQNAIANIKHSIKIYFIDRLDELSARLATMDGYRVTNFTLSNASGPKVSTADYIRSHSENIDRALEGIHLLTMFDQRIYDYFRHDAYQRPGAATSPVA